MCLYKAIFLKHEVSLRDNSCGITNIHLPRFQRNYNAFKNVTNHNTSCFYSPKLFYLSLMTIGSLDKRHFFSLFFCLVKINIKIVL